MGDNGGIAETTLADLLNEIDSLDDNLTIYASKEPRWTGSSRSVACREPDDGSVPPEAEGLNYMLEVDRAKDAIRVWREWRVNAVPALIDKCEAVIYYATHDAYLPPSRDPV